MEEEDKKKSGLRIVFPEGSKPLKGKIRLNLNGHKRRKKNKYRLQLRRIGRELRK